MKVSPDVYVGLCQVYTFYIDTTKLVLKLDPTQQAAHSVDYMFK